MKTIGIFYATLTKTTVGVVDELEFFLKHDVILKLLILKVQLKK